MGCPPDLTGGTVNRQAGRALAGEALRLPVHYGYKLCPYAANGSEGVSKRKRWKLKRFIKSPMAGLLVGT